MSWRVGFLAGIFGCVPEQLVDRHSRIAGRRIHRAEVEVDHDLSTARHCLLGRTRAGSQAQVDDAELLLSVDSPRRVGALSFVVGQLGRQPFLDELLPEMRRRVNAPQLAEVHGTHPPCKLCDLGPNRSGRLLILPPAREAVWGADDQEAAHMVVSTRSRRMWRSPLGHAPMMPRVALDGCGSGRRAT
jgi:hypothetical protein